MLDNLLKIIAPHICLVCGKEDALLCNWCQIDACPEVPPRCYSCYALSPDSAVCTKCRRKSPLKHVWVATEYSDTAKRLIHSYKFKHTREAAKLIAKFIEDNLPYLNDAIVMAVPTASGSIRQRGFDHAQLIAKELAKYIRLPYLNAIHRSCQAKQVGHNRRQRLEQLGGIFRVSSSQVKDMDILLVDDVVTTGATLEEVARTLKRAGVKTINAAVFAQKM